MKRRQFIAGLGSAVAWLVGARTQQADCVRRIRVLLAADENNPLARPRLSAFKQALRTWPGPMAATYPVLHWTKWMILKPFFDDAMRG